MYKAKGIHTPLTNTDIDYAELLKKLHKLKKLFKTWV